MRYTNDIRSIQSMGDGSFYAIQGKNKVIKINYGGSISQVIIDKSKGKTFFSIYFLNDSAGYLAGNNGLIMRSVNKGETWTDVNVNERNHFNRVHFFNSRNGFVIGENGIIYKSDSGGEKWEKKNSLVTTGLWGIAFTDELNGYIVGRKGTLLNTKDGGNTWHKLNFRGNENLWDVKFINQFIGYIVGDRGTILTTTNGGISWTRIDTIVSDNFYEINFIEDNVYIKGRKNLLYSKDAVLWETKNSIPKRFMEELNLVDNLNGKAIGAFNFEITLTYDTLHSEKIFLPGKRFLNKVVFTDANTGYIVGSRGIIYKTTNGGASWDKLVSNTKKNLTAIYFVNADIGYAGNNKTILKTIDGGKNWNLMHKEKGLFSWYGGIYALNKDTCFATGNYNCILKTTNGGNSWNNSFIKYIDPEDLNNNGMSEKSNRYIKIRKKNTEISGDSLAYSLSSNRYIYFNDIFFTDNNIGYAVGWYGKKFKTTDYGETWNLLDPNSEFNGWLGSVYFINSEVGFAVGKSDFPHNQGIIQTTYDGGVTWTTSYLRYGDQFNSIMFTDEQIGYIVGIKNRSNSNIVLKTMDGGKNWHHLQFEGKELLNSVYLVNKNLGFAVGNSGLIWRFNPSQN